MILWLFYIANSATSIVCMGQAFGIFAVARHNAVSKNPTNLVKIIIIALIVAISLELLFDVKSMVLNLFDRRPDLTDRVPMWHDLLAMAQYPILGAGFESFWTGERRALLIEKWGIPGQAHNGYIQQYLEIGIIGAFFLCAWIVSGLAKAAKSLRLNYEWAVLSICIIMVAALYNWTEATFYGLSNMWVFLVALMDARSGSVEGSNRARYQ